MTGPRGTDRPFTVIVCDACDGDPALSVIDELRPVIQNCPHAMVISAGCVLGPVSCAARQSGCGVIAIVQPCTRDRRPCGAAHWLGPISEPADAAALRDWIESGQWERAALPEPLARHVRWAEQASQNN